MTIYSPSRAYEPQLDIRFSDGAIPPWATPVIMGWPPNSQCWLVVMPRRSGKSWFAAAVHGSRERDQAGRTDIVDLRGRALSARKAGVYSVLLGGGRTQLPSRDGILIIDEPGPAAQADNAAKFASGMVRIRQAGALPIVLLTPGELEMLFPHLEIDAAKDVIFPPGLLRVEADRMAGRAPQWAPFVVDEISQSHPQWLQSPFLLELLLHVAEQRPDLRTDLPRLLRAAMDTANSSYQYLEQVLQNGLTGQQRADLRAVRWRDAGIDRPAIAGDRLVGRTTIPNDPVVKQHLPEVLRIHHISDLHHGGKLRANIDAKDKSLAGRNLAQLAGAGTPLDSYLAHVMQLRSGNQAPHIVLVTGDLVDRPDNASGAAALAWLQQLRNLLAPHPDLAPSDPRIVLVGGNHDVSWDLSLEADRQARHKWFATVFSGYPHPDLDRPPAEPRRLEVRYTGAGLRLLLLGSAESGGEVVSDEDIKLVQEFKAKLATEADNLAMRDLVQRLERIDPGIVARVILDQIRPEPGMLTFAALHHPVSPVPAVEVAPYSGIVNAGQVKRMLATARTALVLHGHTHMAFLAAERILNPPNWTMRIAGAASLAAATSHEQNGYNQVFVGREGGMHTVLLRPMRLDGGQWTAQESFAFRPGEPEESPLDRLGLDVARVGAHRG